MDVVKSLAKAAREDAAFDEALGAAALPVVAAAVAVPASIPGVRHEEDGRVSDPAHHHQHMHRNDISPPQEHQHAHHELDPHLGQAHPPADRR